MDNFHNVRCRSKCLDIFKRELGLSHPSGFARRFAASEGIVQKLMLYGNLSGHASTVNALHFNSTGNLLVSASDDREVMLWDWESKTKSFAYHSGHDDNVFQVKIMPFTDDSQIVTSAADGEVRLGLLSSDGRADTKLLGRHSSYVYQLAVEPGSPRILYSGGEDGLIQHFDLRSKTATKILRCSSMTRTNSKIGLTSLVIDPRNPYYFAVGGFDQYALVYDIRKIQWDASRKYYQPVNTFCPQHLVESKSVHISGMAYSRSSELLVSYNDELVYLFEENGGLGSSPSSATPEELKNIQEPQVYLGHRNAQTVKGVGFFGPNDEYVMSGSDCAHIFIWKKKGGKLVRLMVGDQHVVSQLESHPHIPTLATCGSDSEVKVWVPLPCDVPPIPYNVKQITETNRERRQESLRDTFAPDVIMHVLRLHRQQTLAYIERRYVREHIVNDNEDSGSHILGLYDDDEASSDEDLGENSDCNIS